MLKETIGKRVSDLKITKIDLSHEEFAKKTIFIDIIYLD